MIERVAGDLFRYNMAPCDGRTETRVGVAVSGGADSVCLLECLRELSQRLDMRLTVLHVNHGMRGGDARRDAEFVEALAKRYGLPFLLEETDVPALAARDGENLEQAARNARYAFFRRLLAEGTLDRVATGHTRDDQAETVLHRILRGTGLTGLAGILPVTGDGIVRPLLNVSRGEIEEWLKERGIAWREDATNGDAAFTRNRLRHSTLPSLRSAFNPQLDAALVSLAELAREEEEYWATTVRPPEVRGHCVYIKTAELLDSPAAMARRRLRAAMGAVKGDLRQIEFGHVERVLEMAREREGSGRTQLPGLDVYRSFDWLRFAPAGHDHGRRRNFEFAVSVPSETLLPGGGRIELAFAASNDSQGCDTVKMDLDESKLIGLLRESGEPFTLRNWRPGDRYQPFGNPREEKLKTLFQRDRVPLWERSSWPVLETKGAILWSHRFGAAAGYAAPSGSLKVIQVRERSAKANESAIPRNASD